MENNIILYTTSDGHVNIQVQFEDDTFWLTQKRMAELFGVDVRTVNEHLQNIFKSGELEKEATIRKIRMVASLISYPQPVHECFRRHTTAVHIDFPALLFQPLPKIQPVSLTFKFITIELDFLRRYES